MKEQKKIYALYRVTWKGENLLGVFVNKVWAEINLSVLNERARKIRDWAVRKNINGEKYAQIKDQSCSCILKELDVLSCLDYSLIKSQMTLGQVKKYIYTNNKEN